MFGNRCWSHLDKQNVGKLDARAWEALFAGYACNIRGNELCNVPKQKVEVSGDVNFEEIGSNFCVTTDSDKKAQPDTTVTKDSDKDESEDQVGPSPVSEQTSEFTPALQNES